MALPDTRSTTPRLRQRRRRVAAAATGLTAIALFSGGIQTAGAVTGPAGLGTYAPVDLHAYVGAGETLNVLAAPGGTTVTGPGAPTVTCTPMATCQGLSGDPGIWRISLTAAGTWNVEVRDGGGTEIPGRVWSEFYNTRQQTSADITFHYQSKLGYLYRATYLNYNGINSEFSANATGVRFNDTCVSAYASINTMGPDIDTERSQSMSADNLDECGDPYKIFFQEPATDLPETATRWDGSTDWIKPDVETPDISAVTFTPDGSGTRAGTIDVTVAGVLGQLTVQIDANDDGDFNDPVDREFGMFAADGSGSVAFDGLDGQGDPIPAVQPFRIRVAAERTGEIHLVNWDAEVRGSGLELARLNGAGASTASPDYTMHWNDTLVSGPNQNRCNTLSDPLDGGDPVLDATDGRSSEGGTHAWGDCTSGSSNANNGINGSWGDQRAIDDWTYVETDAQLTERVGAASTSLTLEKTATLDDDNDNGVADVDETITYGFTVTNTGQAVLNDVTVNDAKVGPVTCTPTTLVLGQSATCTAEPYVVTQADIDAGAVENTATATGTPLGGSPVSSEPDSTRTPTPDRNPELRLAKTAQLRDRNGNGVADAGEFIDYRFVVTNTGNVTIRQVSVDDARLDSVTCDPTTLAPREETVCFGSYRVDRQDLKGDQIVNTATAIGFAPPTEPGEPGERVTSPVDRAQTPAGDADTGDSGGGNLPDTGAATTQLLIGLGVISLLGGATMRGVRARVGTHRARRR